MGIRRYKFFCCACISEPLVVNSDTLDSANKNAIKIGWRTDMILWYCPVCVSKQKYSDLWTEVDKEAYAKVRGCTPKTESNVLYEDFRKWCKKIGKRPTPEKEFFDSLKKQGYKSAYLDGKLYWLKLDVIKNRGYRE